MKIEDNEEISNYLNVIVKVQNESEKVETEIGQIVKTTFPDENPKSKEVRKAQIIKSEIEMGNHEEDIADKKYKCPVPDCNNSYTDGSNYRRHYRKNHKSIETSTTLEKDPEGEDDSITETIKFENENTSIHKPATVQVKAESNKPKMKAERKGDELGATKVCPYCGKVILNKMRKHILKLMRW